MDQAQHFQKPFNFNKNKFKIKDLLVHITLFLSNY